MPSLKELLRTAIAVAVLLAAVSLLTHSFSNAAATKSTAPARGFYLTNDRFQGDLLAPGKPAVCAAGYHMASIWEIHEPSNLRYDTALGVTTEDSGAGPPAGLAGWARSGAYNGDNPIIQNCNNWTSADPATLGPGVQLPKVWVDVLGVNSVGFPYMDFIAPWTPFFRECSLARRVWCVQD